MLQPQERSKSSSNNPKHLCSRAFFSSPPWLSKDVRSPAPTAEVTCVLALSQTPLVSLVTGIAAAAFANVLADQCTVADNSPGLLALTVALFSSITAQKVKVVGGFLGLLGTVTPAPVNAAKTPDPFAGTTIPDISGMPCDPHSFSPPLLTRTITGTVTLSPGRYCGGLTVSGTGNVTLSPGTYYMDGGRGLVGGSIGCPRRHPDWHRGHDRADVKQRTRQFAGAEPPWYREFDRAVIGAICRSGRL